MEGMFSWLIVPNSNIVLSYEKILGFLIYGFMLYSFDKLTYYEKIYVGIFTILIIKLVLESLYVFDTFFQQLTMFYVLFPVMFALFIKYINRIYDLDLLEFIAKFYLCAYIIFMCIYGRGFSFSLEEIVMTDYGPFSGDGRVLHSARVYMMIIPFLWYLHQFTSKHKAKYLIPVFFCGIVIFMHQHRSVWSCAILSTLIFIYLSIRHNHKKLPKIFSLGIGFLLIVSIAYYFAASLFPAFVDFFADRFAEIFTPRKEESTGKFRADQREVYFNLFLQRPLFGWTFEGFEMPNPIVDWWPEKSGQHFHEGYMEMLFYQGIVGFVYKFSLFFYLIYRAFSKRISEQTIILISFCLSGLLFSFNYVLPTIFWGHLGLCLYYIEKDFAAVPVKQMEKHKDISFDYDVRRLEHRELT
jgi:hypothetical protein